ncbi:hypothetical protein THAOC_02735, partial [Thalassiosira oceanica]
VETMTTLPGRLLFWGPPSWGPSYGGKGGKSGGYGDDDYSPWSPPFWGPSSWGAGPYYSGGKSGKTKGGY